jgi:S-adenosylmethionine decarboxylase
MKSVYNYLINVFLEKPEMVENALVLQKYLIKIAEKLGFSVIGEQSYKFTPIGVTSLIMLSESHISIHTWPEYSFGAIDILTCSGRIDEKKLMDLISDDLLGIRITQVSEIRRDMLVNKSSGANLPKDHLMPNNFPGL